MGAFLELTRIAKFLTKSMSISETNRVQIVVSWDDAVTSAWHPSDFQGSGALINFSSNISG